MKRRGQQVILAGHGHLALLHRLQEGRLRAWARAIDLVGHQQLGEDRAGDEAEALAAGAGVVEHLGAQNVGRHQVGRELHPFLGKTQDDAQGLGKAGLGQARHADQERMATGQERDQRVLDNALLTEDDPTDLLLDLIQLGDGRLDRGGNIGILVGDERHADPSGKWGHRPDSKTLPVKMEFGKPISRTSDASGARASEVQRR